MAQRTAKGGGFLGKMAPISPLAAMIQAGKAGNTGLAMSPALATYNAMGGTSGEVGAPGTAGIAQNTASGWNPLGNSNNPMAPQAISGTKQGWGEYLWGAPEKSYLFPQFNAPQQQGFQFALQNALQNLGNNQFDFAPIEEQARMGFQQNTIPSIAERFSSLGAQRSSAFGQQLGAAGANLERDLAAMKANYNLQRQPMFQNLLQLGLTPQYQSFFAPATQGLIGGAAQTALPLAAKAAMAALL